MKFVKNQTYEWNDILFALDAEAGPVYFLLHHKVTGKVVAACVRIDMNPRAPYEIIPGNGVILAPWTDKFCDQNGSFPVFVKELDDKWYYRGDFKIVAQTADANEIRLREQQAKRAEVYKIIFLEEAAQ